MKNKIRKENQSFNEFHNPNFKKDNALLNKMTDKVIKQYEKTHPYSEVINVIFKCKRIK